jgi:hypothetical protein
MKRILTVLAVLTLTGCFNEPQSVEHTGKDDKFEIEYLFTIDGIKMYRFADGSHYHYFTTNGETITTQQNGKVTYQEHIKTKYKMSDDEFYQLKGEIEHETK